jgi:outer membrane protein TolC
LLIAVAPLLAHSPPPTPYRPWHTPEEGQIAKDGKRLRQPPFRIEPDKIYSLAELIDLAETHNPETRVAWENAKAEAAALGIARSELYPTLAALAQLGVERAEIPFGSQFYRQTVPAFEVTLDLNYTVFDFGARRGRIGAEVAKVLAANFAFNDVHRRIIYQVQQAYYRLLNAFGQEAAARASLANAQAVQQAAGDVCGKAWHPLPDVLEAAPPLRTQYELQAVLASGRDRAW